MDFKFPVRPRTPGYLSGEGPWRVHLLGSDKLTAALVIRWGSLFHCAMYSSFYPPLPLNPARETISPSPSPSPLGPALCFLHIRGSEPAEQSQMLANHQLHLPGPKRWTQDVLRPGASAEQPTDHVSTLPQYCWALTRKIILCSNSNTCVHTERKQLTRPGIRYLVATLLKGIVWWILVETPTYISKASPAPSSSFLPRLCLPQLN